MVHQPGFAQTSDPDILEMTRGGWRQSAFGLPFLFTGLFILQIPFDLIPVKVEEGPVVLALILPLGLVFAIAGAALVFIRNGITINRRNRTITQWWGLLIPMKKTEYSLDVFDRVCLDLHRAERDPGDTYIINLIGSGHTPPFYIPSPGGYRGTLQVSEQLSRFLEIPLKNIAAEKLAASEEEEVDDQI
jgi:hypothetical protein